MKIWRKNSKHGTKQLNQEMKEIRGATFKYFSRSGCSSRTQKPRGVPKPVEPLDQVTVSLPDIGEFFSTNLEGNLVSRELVLYA